MRNIVFVASIHHNRNRVVHIFLNGIVHATFTVSRAGTVVIHSQSSTYIYEFYREAQLMQLHIELRSLTQCCLDATYLSHLTTYVEMNQLQAILHFFLFQEIKCLEQLTGSQSELAGIASAFFPLSATGRS